MLLGSKSCLGAVEYHFKTKALFKVEISSESVELYKLDINVLFVIYLGPRKDIVFRIFLSKKHSN